MKRLTPLLLSLLLLLGLTGCRDVGVIGGADGPTSIIVSDILPDGGPSSSEADTGFVPVEGEYYYDLENVVLYLEYYGMLPDNYITKGEARALGWEGGTPERFLEGSAIGGDPFGNREGILPAGSYTECDLNTLGADSRGGERLVFSEDGAYYHTEDHYKTFTQVWVEEGEVIW